MPLPDTPKFEALLNSFSRTKPEPSDAWREFVAVPAMTLTEDGSFVERRAVTFWYREESDLTMESLLRTILRELRQGGHVAQTELAATIAAMFAYSTGPTKSSVERFNMLFGNLVSAQLHQFFLFPALQLATYRVDIGPFSIGPFNPERLAYLSRKSGSDFYDRYESFIRRVPFSVERKARPVQVIYCHRLFTQKPGWHLRSTGDAEVLFELVDHYFAQLSALHFKDLFTELQAIQEVPMGLGSGWFDLNTLRSTLKSQPISIYLKIGGDEVGFVSPSANLVWTINLGGGHLGMPFTEKYLYRNFGFEGFSDCEIHQSLKNFCHFLALAVQHRHARREADAFLHNVIALDLLLGDAGSSTNSVTTRSAALVFRSLDRDFPAMVKELQRIYDARSKYMHEGKLPDSMLLPMVETICREVAFCLFRLQREARNRIGGFSDRWLKDIDFVIAAIEAGRPVVDDDWQRAGVALSNDVRHSSFIAELKQP